MNGQRYAALLGQRRQHVDAVEARGVHDDRSRPHRRCGSQARHQTRQLGVRHREQQQLRVTGDVGHRRTGVSGSQRSARCRDARDTALHATTTWSTRSSATPSAVPTLPAEMIPT